MAQDIQERFWKEFYESVYVVNYTNLYLGETERIDRRFKIFLALSSSASIGAWAVWKDYATVWVVIIAASQILSVMITYLPYRERIKGLVGVRNELGELAIHMESKWSDVMAGELTSKQIDEIQLENRARRQRSVQKYFPLSTPPVKPKLAKEAEGNALKYFNRYYPVIGK